jgi:hypothetical protein
MKQKTRVFFQIDVQEFHLRKGGPRQQQSWGITDNRTETKTIYWERESSVQVLAYFCQLSNIYVYLSLITWVPTNNLLCLVFSSSLPLHLPGQVPFLPVSACFPLPTSSCLSLTPIFPTSHPFFFLFPYPPPYPSSLLPLPLLLIVMSLILPSPSSLFSDLLFLSQILTPFSSLMSPIFHLTLHPFPWPLFPYPPLLLFPSSLSKFPFCSLFYRPSCRFPTFICFLAHFSFPPSFRLSLISCLLSSIFHSTHFPTPHFFYPALLFFPMSLSSSPFYSPFLSFSSFILSSFLLFPRLSFFPFLWPTFPFPNTYAFLLSHVTCLHSYLPPLPLLHFSLNLIFSSSLYISIQFLLFHPAPFSLPPPSAFLPSPYPIRPAPLPLVPLIPRGNKIVSDHVFRRPVAKYIF